MARHSHDPQSCRILVLGRDISRLSSGANVLTQAGYAADLVLKVDQAVRRVLVERYQLAIVCFTFSRDEQIAVRARLKQVRQDLPVLLLTPKHDSPDALLTSVADRLKKAKLLQFGPVNHTSHLDHGAE